MLKFANLFSRLLDQVNNVLHRFKLFKFTLSKPVLSKKHASVLFLHSLGSSSRPSNSMTQPLSAKFPSLYRVSETQLHGKSKADILKSYRHKSGKLRVLCHRSISERRDTSSRLSSGELAPSRCVVPAAGHLRSLHKVHWL